MKRLMIVAALAACTLVTGCGTTPVNVNTANISATGEEKTIGIGDVFFDRVVMTGQKNVGDPNNSVFGGEAYKFDLVLESASKDLLKLGYSEYMKQPSPYGYYELSPWTKKPAFSRTLEYDLKDSKRVTYKSYVFEVLNSQNGMVTYKRIQ